VVVGESRRVRRRVHP